MVRKSRSVAAETIEDSLGPASALHSIQGVSIMRKLFAWPAILLLAALCVAYCDGWSQASSPAGAQGTGAAGNPPQQGGARASGPIAGPPHDPRDLNGVWNMRF